MLLHLFNTAPSTWTTYSFNYTANGSNTELTFAGANNTNYDYLANVDVSHVSSGVPETSTWAMMMIGFAGLGFVAHRRAVQKRFVGFSAV